MRISAGSVKVAAILGHGARQGVVERTIEDGTRVRLAVERGVHAPVDLSGTTPLGK